MKLTACVYTKNNEDFIEDAVKSLHFADEIILLDSGSQDATISIAEPHVHRVEHRAWTGFCDQLNHIMTLATHPWILVLDADERITEKCAQEIKKVLSQIDCDAWELPRLSRYLGRWLRHGEFYPDYTLRLYRQGTGHYEGEPHARFISQGNVGRLKEPLEHLFHKDMGEQFDRMRDYGQQYAQDLANKGRRSARVAALVHCLQRFFKGYVFKAGFLDGWAGFVAAVSSSFHVFIKYVRVEEESQKTRNT